MSKILYIEDEQTLLKLMELTLKAHGFEVLTAANAEQAFVVLNDKPDLILCDILLPGMSGLELLGKLKFDDNTKNIPVIMFSNFNDPEKIQEARSKGALDYLVKANSDVNTVILKVKEVLGV